MRSDSQLDNKSIPFSKVAVTELSLSLKSRYHLFMILIVSLIVFTLFFKMTYPNLDKGTPITIIIHSLWIIGFCMVFKVISKIELEKAIVNFVEERGAKYLGEIKAKKGEMVDLDRLEEMILPFRPWKNPPAMIRLFQHICKEARDRQFESSINVIQPYREESIGDLYNIQKIEKMALHLGILGTFIGLILALFNFQQGSIITLKFDKLPDLFNSLYISLSTSIAGLEVAIFISVMLMLVRKNQQAYFQKMECAVVTMLSLARNAEIKDNFLTAFSQVTHSINKVEEKVIQQTKAVEDQTNTIQGGLLRLAQVKKEFNDFLSHLTEEQTMKLVQMSGQLIEFNNQFRNKIEEAQKSFIGDMRGVYDITSLKVMSLDLQKIMTEIIEKYSLSISQNLLIVSEKLAEFNKSPEILNETIEKLDIRINKQFLLVQGEVSTLAKAESEASKLHKQMVQLQLDFKNNLEKISTETRILNTTLNNLNILFMKKEALNEFFYWLISPFVFIIKKFKPSRGMKK
ncbi:MAG: hypothetical protein NT166_27190 [Candidatus Aminicenantes bacterium]|nr:hypothetical protein [Candidatus Aminicenantes bacterium]